HVNLDQGASVETERVQAADRCRDHVSVATDDPRVAAYATEVQLTAGGHTPDVDELAGTVVIRDNRPMRLDLLQPMRRDVPLEHRKDRWLRLEGQHSTLRADRQRHANGENTDVGADVDGDVPG